MLEHVGVCMLTHLCNRESHPLTPEIQEVANGSYKERQPPEINVRGDGGLIGASYWHSYIRNLGFWICQAYAGERVVVCHMNPPPHV
jgi:hypothetical protein